MKKLRTRTIGFLSLLGITLSIQAWSNELDIEVSTSISSNRKYVVFWVENYEEFPVKCSWIRRKVKYKDQNTGESFGDRIVSLRDITIAPGEIFNDVEGGKSIIDLWEAENRYAVIDDIIGTAKYSCTKVIETPKNPCKSVIGGFMDHIESRPGFGVAAKMSLGSIWRNGNQFGGYGDFKTDLVFSGSGDKRQRYISKRYKVYFSDRAHFAKNRADELTLFINDSADIYMILHSWGNAYSDLYAHHCRALGKDKVIIQASTVATSSNKTFYTIILSTYWK